MASHKFNNIWKKKHMAVIYHTKIKSKISNTTFSKYLNAIPDSFQDKVKRYRKRFDQDMSIVGKALLLHGLTDFGYSNITLKELRTDNYHRPYIDDQIDFNISHSGNHVICALSESGRVGLDVEITKPLDTFDLINVFNIEIREKILRASDKTKETYRYWTIVEAVLKADGRGMYFPLSELTIRNGTADIDGKTWQIHEIPVGKNAVCHCATEKEERILLKKRPMFN